MHTAFLLCFLSLGGGWITPSDTLQPLATELYGPPATPVRLRLGNGGAGPTGILKALAEDYLLARGQHFAIAWVQNISRFTLQALQEGLVDVALTYEAEDAQRGQREGWASREVLVFNDHFMLVGPRDNPAGVQQSDTPMQAFARLAAQGAPFLSRDDDSGTNHREQWLWRSQGVEPWLADGPAWYHRDRVFPADALTEADAMGAYTLTDRGTWLSVRQRLPQSAVLLAGGPLLLNPCHAVTAAQPSPLARDFVAYLQSPRAQLLIAAFGWDGEPLFTPAAQPDFTGLPANAP